MEWNELSVCPFVYILLLLQREKNNNSTISNVVDPNKIEMMNYGTISITIILRIHFRIMTICWEKICPG